MIEAYCPEAMKSDKHYVFGNQSNESGWPQVCLGPLTFILGEPRITWALSLVRGLLMRCFSSLNGLFLYQNIEAALKKGLIAIVPDPDLENCDKGGSTGLGRLGSISC